MNIGVVVAMQEELDNILYIFREHTDYYEQTTLRENVILMRLRENKFYFYKSGIGQLNAALACSKLRNEFDCKTIYNIGCCGCLINKDQYVVGSVIEFDKNILNLSFKLNPYKYHYDNAGVSDSFNLFSDKVNLLLSSDDFLEENISSLPYLKLNRYRNVFIDMEAYGVLAYCTKNDINYKIIKVVFDFCVEKDFDKNVSRYQIYENLYNSLKNVLK